MLNKYLKKLPLLLLTSLLLPLTSCDNKNMENNSKSDLIISEIVEGKYNNRAIELYNKSSKDLNLEKYSIEIELKNTTKIIDLSGTILAKQTFVIAYTDACDEITSKADLISKDLMFNGTQPIMLKYKNKIVDIIGEKSFQINYYTDITLVRKKEYLVGRNTFDEYDWIRYNCDNYKYLKTIDTSISDEELLNGPILSDEFKNSSFYKTSSSGDFVGTGGIIEVSVSSYVDGDTTVFKADSNITNALGFDSSNVRVRYQNIDTPESYQGNVQEFGIVAKEFTNEKLAFANKIYLQSILDGSITETYGRMLAFVWVDDALLNLEIVKAGYSELEFSSVDTMLYKDVSYSNFLYNAQLYAKKNKKGIHGEVDPYWDYENNKVKDNAPGVNPGK